MDKESNRNTIIFMVCALVMLFFYQVFVMGPITQRAKAQAQAKAAAAIAACCLARCSGAITNWL